MAEEKSNNGRSAGMKVDTALVRELAELLNEVGLTEIEVEDGGRKIRVMRGGAATTVAAVPLAAPAPAGSAPPVSAQQSAGVDTAAVAPAPSPELAPPASANIVNSPMVGTVYLHPEPGADPFIRKGDRVKAGDTLLIVEAMKVMNPIVAPSDGMIADILVENAQPIEFDQPLIVLG